MARENNGTANRTSRTAIRGIDSSIDSMRPSGGAKRQEDRQVSEDGPKTENAKGREEGEGRGGSSHVHFNALDIMYARRRT